MRTWNTEKKNNLRDKVEKREKATFLDQKTKAEEEKKRLNEEKKTE